MTPLYIFDLDGTLALIEHRRHLVDGRCPKCNATGWLDTPVELPTPVDPGDVVNFGQPIAKFHSEKCPACNNTGRVPDFEAPDWPAFFAACVHDTPNWPVVSTLMALLKSGADVRIWSGRSSVVMNETLDWLHRRMSSDEIDMDDLQLKGGWYDELSEYDKRRLVAIFDDCDKVVAMWRSKGVACFQVAPGDF